MEPFKENALRLRKEWREEDFSSNTPENEIFIRTRKYEPIGYIKTSISEILVFRKYVAKFNIYRIKLLVSSNWKKSYHVYCSANIDYILIVLDNCGANIINKIDVIGLIKRNKKEKEICQENI
jgi:hypothetical protein